jgi:serine phosphatase RsbU (regulator of sigma subunit)
MEYFPKALHLRRENNAHDSLIALSYLNIGSVCQKNAGQEMIDGMVEQADAHFQQAERHYLDALNIYERLKQEQKQALCLNNLGSLADDRSQPEKALAFYRQSEEIYLRTGHVKELATIYCNIGKIYRFMDGKTGEAPTYYRKAIAAIRHQPDALDIAAEAYSAIASFFDETEMPDSAIVYFDKAIETAHAANLYDILQYAYRKRSRLHFVRGDYRKAYHDQVSYKIADDSLNNKEAIQRRIRQSMLHDFDLEQQAQLHRNRVQRILLLTLSAGALLLSLFAVVVWRNYLRKKKLHLLLSQQQKDITDSIESASMIQKATLPPPDYIRSMLGEQFFVLYKPLGIVSGDFYWFARKGGCTVAAAADCTGHGVPGAIVSMLGISLLDKIVARMETPTADGILNELRTEIVRLLNPEAKTGDDTRNGMDIALVVIDADRREMEFAGANNPLYLLRDESLLIYNGNRMPIGLSDRMNEPFTAVRIPYRHNDTIYLFSDGYADQFGGERGERLKRKRFKEHLLSLWKTPIAQQSALLEAKHLAWKGTLEQVDDILIMGINLS